MTTLSPHVNRYVVERRARGAAPGTITNIRCHLKGLDESFGNRPLEQLGPKAIDRWIDTLEGLAPGTRRSRMSTVRRFCRWLQKRKLIAGDPCGEVDPSEFRVPRSVPRALDDADQQRVLAAAPDLRAKAIIHLMLGMGLRACEVSSAQTADWDRPSRLLRVVGKGGHERIVVVPDAARRALETYLAWTGDVDGPLIRRYDNGARVSAGRISAEVVAWMYAAGVKKAPRDRRGGHSLRHSYASDLLVCADFDLRVVSEALGHAHLSSTEVYLRQAGLQKLSDAVDRRFYGGDAA